MQKPMAYQRQLAYQTTQRLSLFSYLTYHSFVTLASIRERAIPSIKKLAKSFTSVVTAGLLLGSSMVMAQGQIAVVTNDDLIESGEEIGATVVLNGDGRYDVYIGITGGYFGSDIYAFTTDGRFLVKWDYATGVPPDKFLADVDLSAMPVSERVIRLFPRIPLPAELRGSYVFLAALSTPGQLDLPVIDQWRVEVK
jgi:hypothetical protein